MNKLKLHGTLNSIFDIYIIDVENIMDLMLDENSIIRNIKKAYTVAYINNKMSYILMFVYKDITYIILEQWLSKKLYRDYNINISPFIKFKSHVIIPLTEFYNNVDPAIIMNIYSNN